MYVIKFLPRLLKLKNMPGTSLVVQWLRLCTPSAGASCSTPGQGTRSRIPQLRVRMPELKDPECTIKTQHSHIYSNATSCQEYLMINASYYSHD